MEAGSERVCYVHCSFCNTVLVVSVPCTSMFNIVTVRCGHCANLLSVNMGALPQPSPVQHHPTQSPKQHQTCTEGGLMTSAAANMNYSSNGSSSSSSPSKYITNKLLPGSCESSENVQPPPRLPPVRPLEKRQRVPSAYNRFIKEEIQRIKASTPDISHREAFSAAAKNWAHFPHIRFGLKKAKVVDQDPLASNRDQQSSQKSSLAFY